VAEVVWTRQAIEDLEEIRRFIARDSEHYAALVRRRLVEAVERLEVFPLSGRVVPEFGREAIREVIWGNYRIVYRVRESLVEVVTVFHGSRLLRELSDG
jgi:addiction module RelE/StbE family toxin